MFAIAYATSPLVSLNRRSGGDDRGDAADAGTRCNQSSEPRRQPQLVVEPGDEDQPRGDRGHHDREAGRTQADDIKGAEPDADEHDSQPQHCRDTEVEAGHQDRGKRKEIAQRQPEDDRDGHTGNGRTTIETLCGEERLSEHVGKPEAREHDGNRSGNPGQK